MKTLNSINKIIAAAGLTFIFSVAFNATLFAQQDYATDPHLTPAVKKFLEPLNAPGPGLETLPPVEARKVLVNAQASVKFDYSGVEETEKTIVADGHSIKLNIMRPKGAKGQLPVFIYIHGGGWVLGDYPTHKRMVRDLVEGTGYAAVFVNYTPSPEAKYPVALNEIYAASVWVSDHGAEINVNGKDMGIVGNSVGGNMSTATALMANAKGKHLFKVEVLLWPVTNANFDNESWKAYGSQRFLTAPLMKWMWDNYIPVEKRNEIYACPLLATPADMKGLPPTLIMVAENDILRDEAEEYGRKLDDAGVTETTIRFNGVIHDFGLLNGLAEIPQTKALFLEASATLKKYLK
jgi:acetyl esterase/lipase